MDVLESKIEELVEVILDSNDLENKVLVGALLMKHENEKLIECLKRNKDVFSYHRETF